MQDNSEAKVSVICNKRIDAITTHVTGTTQIKIAGASVATPDAVKVYKDELAAITAVNSARTALSQALAVRDAADDKRRAFDKGLKSWTFTEYGADSKETGDFGFKPKKAKPTVETKALAAAKARGTREARGTMGKKQKKNIKGSVVALTVQESPAAKDATAAKTGTTTGNGTTNGGGTGSTHA